jgi:hypothetical protein
MEGHGGIGPSSGCDQVDHYLGEDPGSDGRGRTYKCCGGFRPYTPTFSNFLGRCAAALLRLCFAGGQSLCPVALGVPAIGLIDAAASQPLAAELARLGPHRTCSLRWIWIPRAAVTFRPGSPR